MKRLRLKDLEDNREGHFLKSIVKEAYLQGGFSFKKPGYRTHDEGCTCNSCDGEGHHIHDDSEIFILLLGKAVMQLDGVEYPMTTGDIFVCEPGEDHHLVSDMDDPCANLWMHGSDVRHKDQLV